MFLWFEQIRLFYHFLPQMTLLLTDIFVLRKDKGFNVLGSEYPRTEVHYWVPPPPLLQVFTQLGCFLLQSSEFSSSSTAALHLIATFRRKFLHFFVILIVFITCIFILSLFSYSDLIYYLIIECIDLFFSLSCLAKKIVKFVLAWR